MVVDVVAELAGAFWAGQVSVEEYVAAVEEYLNGVCPVPVMGGVLGGGPFG